MAYRYKSNSAFRTLAGDPRLLEQVGRDYALQNGIMPLRSVGALTLVAAYDMWARIETIDHLEARLGAVTFMPADRAGL